MATLSRFTARPPARSACWPGSPGARNVRAVAPAVGAFGPVSAQSLDLADVGLSLVSVRGEGEHGDARGGGVQDERDRAEVGAAGDAVFHQPGRLWLIGVGAGAGVDAQLGLPARCPALRRHAVPAGRPPLLRQDRSRERGLADVLGLEFEPAPYALSSVLTYCDMTTSPDGEPVPAYRRLAEINHRYGQGHLVSRSIQRATPMILRAVEQVQDRASRSA
jgi:hypothetical protein